MTLPSSAGKAPNVFLDVSDNTGSPSTGGFVAASRIKVTSLPGPGPTPPLLVVQPRWSNGVYYNDRTYSNSSPQEVILAIPNWA